MLATEEKIIIEDYKKAVNTYYQNKEVIDIDSKVRIRLDCWAARIEKLITEAGSYFPPQRQSRFMIVFSTAGEGIQKVGDLNISLKADTLLVIPGRVIYSSTQSDNTKGYFLLFNLNFFLQNPFPKHHLLKMDLLSSNKFPFAYVNTKESKHIRAVFETILDEQHHGRKKKEELITLKVLELLIISERVSKLTGEVGANIQSPPAMEFLQLVQQHYKEHHSTAFYAQKLYLHPNSLNAIAKRHLGQSAKATIDAAVVAEAKYLLYQTNLSAKEIAFELGFQSATYFFRFFKKHTGISPVNYRKSEFENVMY
jgi:AraC-like DNA-binding protein